MSSFLLNGTEVATFTFPGGEVHCKLTEEQVAHIRAMTHNHDTVIKIDAFIENASDLLMLLMIYDTVEALQSGHPIELFVPYIPYGRQDRQTSEREPFSLRFAARLINSMNYSRLITIDPHSDVTPALIHKCKINTKLVHDTLDVYFNEWNPEGKRKVLVLCPDQGAVKRTNAMFNVLKVNHPEIQLAFASKYRDEGSGEMSQCRVELPENIEDFDKILVLDDICDGGRSYTNIIAKIREKSNIPCDLFVTHGIFSKGMKVLTDHYANVGCVNRFKKYEDLV